MIKTKLDFHNAYLTALKICHTKNPTRYAWPIANAEIVTERMMIAIAGNTYNLDSPALKSVMCAEKIAYNRKSIAEFYNSLV